MVKQNIPPLLHHFFRLFIGSLELAAFAIRDAHRRPEDRIDVYLTVHLKYGPDELLVNDVLWLALRMDMPIFHGNDMMRVTTCKINIVKHHNDGAIFLLI